MIDKLIDWCVAETIFEPKFVISIIIGFLSILVSYHYGKHKGMKVIQRQRQSSGNMEQEQYQEVK